MSSCSKQTRKDLWASWQTISGVHSLEFLKDWISQENKETRGSLLRTSLLGSKYWFLDSEKSEITNKNHSFFTINGVKGCFSNGTPFEQPIILQNEVGYLGFIAKKINGVLHLLMQAKIEPGNVNNVQISPTIQATESNFTQKHGGRAPHYLDYFQDVSQYEVIYDGLQSEQCSRFLGKYNRNVAILVNDDVPVLPHFEWMTIGQIKQLADHYDNLVNMDTRTVLSCLPFDDGHSTSSEDKANELLGYLNQYRERSNFNRSVIPLNQLKDWRIDDSGIYCQKEYPFDFQYFSIAIEGREVSQWDQPLAVARGMATFGLFALMDVSPRQYLIKIKEEVGCKDVALFGPSVQLEENEMSSHPNNPIDALFMDRSMSQPKTLVSTILSEEGGRFYHEQNYNIIFGITRDHCPQKLPPNYFWADYDTILSLIHRQAVNIQLRDLLSLLEDGK
jgi:oxidase EvaA